MDKENTVGQVSAVETFPLKRNPTESIKGSLSERKAHKPDGKEIEKQAMEPFVTVRPPRGRRDSQSFAAMVPTNPATVDTVHPSSSKALSHRHRSSSQPRPSRTVQPLPPRQMENSIRSASQPRSSQNTHFLDGFNVDGCFDVRSIPDPPTPNSSRKRNRRRVSSAVLRPMSSMDVDNRGNEQTAISNDIDGSDKKSSFVTRRKRKTLSHVPSPFVPEGEQKFELESNISSLPGSEERCDVEARSNSPQINLCRDEGEDESVKLSPKRRKKRQSMVIPRDLPLGEDGSSPNNALVSDSPNKTNVAANSSPKAKKEFVPLDFKSMQNLRSLVRGYCSLSSGDKQGSNEAKEILAMTGYALPQKAIATDDGNNSMALLSNRRAVIKKIAPVLQQLESRKKQDVKSWEDKTQCRVTKSDRSGRYKYYDVETNKKVGSQEYKRRYISVLEHERPDRELRARKWMDELNHPNTFHAIKEAEKFEYPSYEEQNQLDIIEMQQKEAFLPPRNTNLARDRDFVTIESTRDEMAEIAEITEASSEDTDDNSRESISPNPDTTELVEAVSINDALPRSEHEESCDDIPPGYDAVGNDDTEPIPLLPLPSKDSESMDPEIAAAEKRLWDKIDLALHEYSGEVMMIQRKRRRLHEAHPEPTKN